MSRRSLAWKLYPTMLVLILLCVSGVVLLAMGSARAVYSGMYFQAALAGLAAVVLALAIIVLVASRISRPLKEMAEAAVRFAEGDLKKKVRVPEVREFAVLAEALNQMAGQLDEKIQALLRQRTEQDAVLASMIEGVLAVDVNERIISLNEAVAQLLETDIADAMGRPLSEVARNVELGRFVELALKSQAPVESELLLYQQGKERFLQVRGTLLTDAGGRKIGALLVFNDVTRLHHLEHVRREIVANVSHELRTPITSIKGFIETLREGALHEPDKAQRFLEIIARQADRLNQIIEDLLSLSRIEQESPDAVERAQGKVRDVLQAAIDDCQTQAREANVRVELDCPPDLSADFNAQLVEQALVNLLDNAIKYSPAGSSIRVSAVAEPDQLVLRVQDHGCGIGSEHIGRIFERFYRVDKARSREMGGTGLGLSIVKHIAQAHGGKVSVDSAPGKGSTFTIRLPL